MRWGILRPLVALALVAAFEPAASAQEQVVRRVEARVTAASGVVVHIDQGADAWIEPGDRVRAHPPGGVGVDLIVRAVSRQSARCELVGQPILLEPGVLVEVFVPEERAARRSAPAWTYSEEGWSTDLPLLAPVQGVLPSQRAQRWSGRFFGAVDWTRDTSATEQQYLLARTGLDLRVENAAGLGDVVNFDGELFHRFARIDGDTEDETTRGRIDRLSWRLGDSRERSQSVEVGRFLSSEMPQLGVIDGVEYVRRTESGDRWGASVGLLPVWDATLSTGDDFQAALFYRWFGGERDQFTLAGGIQKTWHEGQDDRDLVVADFGWRASESWRFSGAASIDWYSGDDAPKSSGPELTELQLAALWTPKGGHGASLTYAHIAWPFLLRNDLPPVTAATLADGRVDRVALSGWQDLTRRVRLSARLDQWTSNVDEGGGGEVRVTWRDLLFASSELGGSVFAGQGQWVDVTGARLGLRGWSGVGAWFVTFELSEQDLGAAGPIDAQVWRVGWDGSLGTYWNLSLQADLRTGDAQDAMTLGFALQRRF